MEREMKREIIKRIIVWIVTVAILIAGAFGVKKLIDNNNQQQQQEEEGISCVLNTEDFDGIVAYGDTIDLSLIKITKTENGVSTDIPVDASMVTTHVDTTRVGATTLKLSYDGQTFSVPITVKYKVQFVAGDEVIDTVYALKSSELDQIKAPQKEGYKFIGWSPKIPDILFENMTLAATYEAIIPELSAIDATYGDKLADFKLPANAAGAWRFDNAEGTVGNAGKRTFDVSFVENGTNAVLKTAKLTVNVAKREVNIDVFADFTYNGKRQEPTYKVDVEGLKVSSWLDGDKNYTDAGEYTYHFEVDDANYTGEAKGTYVIKPAEATVKINNYSIFANEALPKIEYQIIGFEGMSQAELAEWIGITIISPETVVVGEHKITATASNKSIQLKVEEGTLTVRSATLEGIGEPVLLSTVATYEDLIGSIGFEMHPNGRWVWKTPDAEVGNVGKQTHVAIFVPSNSAFEPIECDVEITVVAKQLVIEIVGDTVFNYDGKEHKVSFSVKDEKGKIYKNLEVLGNTPYINANEDGYTITLTLADPNYSATKNVTMIIKKVNPVTNFNQTFKKVWSATLKLSDIALPEGYAWANPDKRIEKAGTASYAVIFTPSDTANYNIVNGEFEVEIAKATAKINNVENSYSFTYNGNVFTLDRVTRPHEESKLEFVYMKDGKPVESMKDAGVYTVKITLPESDNYNLAEATTTVTVLPATNTDNVNFSQNATYGDLAQKVIKLPDSTTGTWSIQGADNTTTVGNFGDNTFTLLFTPADGNYKVRRETITVHVAKKQINPPALATDKRAQVYTGQTLTSGLQNGEGYVITDNGGINVNTYTVTVALASTNYIWSDDTTADKTYTYEIIRAKNDWVVAPNVNSWTYGQAGNAGTATAKDGDLVVEYKLATQDDSAYSTALPTNAGNYIARFTVTDSNYEDLTATFAFVIKKQALALPTYVKEYTYTGETIKAQIKASALYSITDNGHINVGNYVATVTLTAPDNYEWAGEAASNKTQPLSYTIIKADVDLNNLNVPDITYGETPTPVVDMGFEVTVTFKYSTTQDGEYTTTVPSAAGKYYVIAEFAGNQNINADKIGPVSFEIKKAQATIQGVRDDKTYTTTYNGTAYSITGVTASNGSELQFTYEGETFTGVTNVGTYVVTITLPDSDNYKGESVNVIIVIDPADNNDVVKDFYDATYGDLVKDIIDLPDGTQGEWRLEGVDESTLVGNVGTHTFKAVFTPDATGNYRGCEVTITIKVAPKEVTAPTIPTNKQEQVYTGQTLTSGLQNGEGYVITDNGGTNVDTYTVTVALESTNYIWSDGTTANKVYTYKIIASQNAEEITTSYNATFGNLLKDVVTLPVGVEGTWSIENFNTATVGNAGTNTFTAVFTPANSNYKGREATITIHVAKATVPAPAIAQNKLSQIYTSSPLNSGLTAAADALYTVADNGGTNVGTYYATLSLKDEANYKWDTTGKSDDIKLAYAIKKAQITFIGDVNMPDWTYNGVASVPTVETNFPCELTYVYATAIDGAYTEVRPTNAGTHYVKAIAAGDGNLYGDESDAVAFTIKKASVTIEGGENSYSKTYDGNAFTLPSVNTSNGADFSSVVITLNGTTVVNTIQGAGEYTITYTVAESDNYFRAERTITVTVEKADVTISDLDIDDWTFGDTAKRPTATATSNVALTYKYFSDAACNNEIAAPTNAGTYYVKAYFAGNDNYNATKTETAVSFTIAKKVVTTPAVPNASVVYNGKTQNSGLTNTLIYTVADVGHKNKGTYDVILTFVNSANYAWNDVDNDNTTVTVQYTITEGTNAISNVSYTANWTYGQPVSAFSAKATYGDIAIKYLVGSEWTEVRPSNAGTYQVVFSTTDENCPIISTDPYTFTIAKAAPVFSGINDTYTDTYDGEAFDLPSVTVSSGATITRVIKLGSATVDAIVGAGVYTITYNVPEVDNYTAGTKTVSVTIEQAQISFVGTPVVNNNQQWIYTPDETLDLPSVRMGQSFVNVSEEVYFEYRYSNDGGNSWTEWTRWGVATFNVRAAMGVPTDAGKYQLRAKVEANVNYANVAELESEVVEFTIAKADPSIENVVANKSYTSTYTGNVYTIPGLSASYTGAPALEYAYTKKNVTTGLFETVSEIRDAGEYSVTVTLPESANYNETDVVVTVTIQKADVTISTITGIDGWTYGDVADTPSATANFGMTSSLVFKYATAIDGAYAEGVPTNAGTYFVKAYFAGSTNLNEAWSAATEFTIAKASVTVPSVSNKPYNKETQNSGLTAGTGYVVKAGTDNGGKNVGDYTVTVSLASDNYIWADGTTADKELSYKITSIENTQDITTSYTTTFGTSISLIQLPDNVEGTWKIEGNPTTVGNAGTNTFVAVFTPDTTGNYNSRRVTITVTVGKAAVPVPSYTNKYTYTGSAIEFVIQNPNWDLYEISGHQQTNVGSYNATLTLKDSSNYVWDGNNTLSYTIEKAKITISDFAIDGWTYGEAAKTPTYTVTFSDKCTVSFEYFDKDGNSLGSTAPTDAGNYSVKATATATDTHNLSDSDVSDPVEFTIAKKDASITANATYTTTYTGNAYTIPGVTASHSESTLQYTVNGVLNGSITDVDTYTVVITLPESTNYNKAEVTVTVTVDEADVTISAPTIQGWTFGEDAKTPSATADFNMTSSLVFKYATAIDGEYTDTVPANAGTYYVKAYFAGNTNLNEAWSAATEFVIAKATIQVPTVGDKEYADGATITSGLTVTEADKYIITEDNGGFELGTYTVTLKIKDAYKNNYEWITSSANASINGDTVVISYRIVKGLNSWQEGKAPAINSWTYGEAGNVGTATPTVGTLVIEYKVRGAEDSTYTTTLPTEAGNYTARFTVTDANHTDLVAWVDFTIHQKQVTVPTIADDKKEQSYAKGETLKSGLVNQEGYVVTDNGGINVGTYTATVSLASSNYIWSDGTTADKTYTYTIVSIANTEEITTSYNNATYGDLLNDVVTLPAGIEGTWSIENFNTATVGNAGTNTFTAVFTPANSNYNGREVTITIVVEKATVTTPDVPNKGQLQYTGNKVESGVASTDLYTATDIGGVVVGKHQVKLSLKDTNNYKWSSTDNSADIYVEYVEIIKAENNDVIPTYTATYGQKLSDITLRPTSTTGTWNWEDATQYVGNAGERTHTLVFTPSDTTNYASRTVEVTVNVGKADATINGVDDSYNFAYTNTEFTVPTATATSGATVTHTIKKGDETVTVIKTVGTYVITYSAASNDNYNTATKEVTVTITEGTNAITNATISGWTYGQAGNTGSATATYGGILIEYSVRNADSYSTTLPTAAGNYTAKFTTTDDNCPIVSTTVDFTIEKATVNVPGIADDKKSQDYTGTTLNSGLTVAEDGLYTIDDDGGITVGDYVATLELKDKANYKWSSGDTDEDGIIELTYSIVQTKITVATPTISGWTYGQSASVPESTPSFTDGVTVTYEYFNANKVSIGTTAPTTAGTYYVVAKATTTNDNLIASDASDYVEFNIAKADASIIGVNNEKKYSKTYDGTDFILPAAIKGNYDNAPAVTYTKYKNAGTYTVVVTLPASTNYNGATETVTIVIEQVENSDVIPTYAPTYGTLLKDLTLPTHALGKGQWAWENVTDETTVGNAGQQTHVLVFTSNDDNYADRTVTVTMTVAKRVITTPDATTPTSVYDSTTKTSGLTDTDVYEVTTDGATEVGEHKAVLTLKDPDNYAWDNVTDVSATTEVEYEITKAKVSFTSKEISIDGWTFGDSANTPTTALVDKAFITTNLIKYEYLVSGNWTTTVPTDAGTYKVRARVASTSNYDGDTTNEYEFTISKKEVEVPSYTNTYVYTGGKINFVVQNFDDTLYTISGHEQINVNNAYKATLTLKDSYNHKWKDGDSNPVELSYSITKASVTLSDLTITDWTYKEYDEAINKPAVIITKTFSDSVTAIFKYSTNGGETWSDTAPVNAGVDYQVKAIVEGTNNYEGDEITTTFTVHKAEIEAPTIPANKLSQAYTGGKLTSGLDGVEGSYTVTDNGGIDVGAYSATLKLADKANYKWDNGSSEDITLPYSIVKADVIVSDLTMNGWTYNENANTLNISANFAVVWSYEYAESEGGEYTATVPTDAGTYYARAVFAGDKNLKAITTNAVAFTIAQVEVTVPEYTNAYTYTGSEIQFVVQNPEWTLYSINGHKQINVSDAYKATLTLEDSKNYKWKNGNSEPVELSYRINKADVTISNFTISGWTYKEAAKTPVVTADFTVTWYYKYATAIDGEYTETVPENAGTYYVKAYFDGNENLNAAQTQNAVSFTIAKATVEVPTYKDAYTYDGSEITVDIPTSTLYGVADHKQTVVGNYQATLTLTDAANYKWEEYDDNNDGIIQVSYSIGKGTISFTGLTAGWEYGTPVKPTVTVMINGSKELTNVEVTFTYSDTLNGEYTATVPTNVGTYYVKANIAGTGNYDAATSATGVEFAITKATATFNKDNSYAVNAEYDPDGYDAKDLLTEVTAAYNGTDLKSYLTYKVTREGVDYDLENVGTYSVIITLVNNNFNATSITVTIEIEPAENRDEVNTTQSATYGDSISEIDLPDNSTVGQWSIKENVTTVGNAGTNTFTAVFTPYDPYKDNYASREETITVSVSKATVPTPTIDAGKLEQTYTSNMLNSGLSSVTGVYTVEDVGGINVGGYTATLKLEDSANHKWSSGDTDGDGIIELAYSIKKAQVSIYEEKVNIAGWTYNSYNANDNVLSGITYDKTFADITVQYQYSTDNGNTWTAWGNPATYNAGNYQVRAIVVGTANYDGDETAAGSFTISKASATINGSTDYSAGYTGSAHTEFGLTASYNGAPAFQYAYFKKNAQGGYDTVNGIVDAGTYKVVVTLPASTNYNSATLTIDPVTITQVTVGISSFQVGNWIYGSPAPFTVVVTLGGQQVSDEVAKTMVTFRYFSDENCVNEVAAPTNAGDTIYYVKAIVTETTNYTGAESAVRSFSIGRATPTWEDIFTGKKFYQNMLGNEVAKLVAKDANGNTVDGKFTFTSTFSTEANKSQIKVTFTATDQVNYVGPTASVKTYNITLATVAYINNSIPYGSIENALAAAGYGDTVWVRPNSVVGMGDIYIMDDVIIKDGVTLLLPYGVTNDISGRNLWTGDLIHYELHGTDVLNRDPADIASDAADLCKVKVILANYTTITINKGGVLEISGQLSGGGGGKKYSGFTAGNHAQLWLAEGATIDNSGTIYVAGFIRELNPEETDSDKLSKVIVQRGGKLEQPYVVCDFAGGTGTSAMYMGGIAKGTKVTPFNRFVMMNVGPTLQINYGGVLRVWAALYASDVNNVTSVNFIAYENSGFDAVIELTDEANSYLTARYNPQTQICDLHVFGGAKTNPMSLTLKQMDITVSTTQFFFPIAHFYHITLEPNRANGQAIATFTMAQEYKLLPGAQLTVEAGAVLNVGGLIVYQDYVDTKTIGAALGNNDQPICRYPSKYINGDDIPWAKLTVNGTMICGSFGGQIDSIKNGALVQITSAVTYTAPEVQKTSGTTGCTPTNITLNAVLLGTQNTTPSVSNIYVYENGEWKTGVAIKLDSVGGNVNGVMGLPVSGNVYANLPTPSKDHYIFDGWYYGDTKVKDGDSLPANCGNTTITLTAKWTAIQYTIKYEGVDMDTGNSIDIGVADGKFTAESTLSLPEVITPTDYYDSGWMFNGKVISELSLANCLAVAKASANGTITVYVRFTKDPYTYKFDMDNDNTGYDLGYNDVQSGLGYDPEENDALMDLVTKYNETTDKEWYFGGWYTDANCTDGNEYTTAYTGDGTKVITLYAKWIHKVSVTYQTKDGSTTYNGDLVTYGTYWYIPGQNNINLPKLQGNDGATTDSSKQHYFGGWTIQVGNADAIKFEVLPGSPYSLTENTIITIEWKTKVVVTISLGEISSFSFGGIEVKNKDKVYVCPDVFYPVVGTVDTALLGGYTINSPTTSSGEIADIQGAGTTSLSFNYKVSAAATLTVQTKYTPPDCIVEGTLITLADGTQKKVEDLTHDDLLLIFNHETGRMEVGYIAMLDHLDVERKWTNVINFVFSNGETLRMVWNHGVFDVTLNKYVLVNEDNYSEFVGHKFYSTYYNGSEFISELVTLTDAFITHEYIKIYNPTSYWHMNYFANGILNVTAAPADHVGGHVNIFELDEDMKYDAEKMQADIEKYGLYTYDDFAEYLTEEQFNALPFAYLKVAVGKGNIDWESIMQIVEYINKGSLLD